MGYGCTLTELTDETWETSVAQWMLGHWEILVDLRTLEEGRSDLVLHANVYPVGRGVYRFELYLVYVP